MVPEMGAGTEKGGRGGVQAWGRGSLLLAPGKLRPRKHFWSWNSGRLALRDAGVFVYGCQGAPLSLLLIGYRSAVDCRFLPGLEQGIQGQGKAFCFVKQGPCVSCSGFWRRDSWCAKGMTVHHGWWEAVCGPGDPRNLQHWLLGSPFKCFQLWQVVKEDLALQIWQEN